MSWDEKRKSRIEQAVEAYKEPEKVNDIDGLKKFWMLQKLIRIEYFLLICQME